MTANLAMQVADIGRARFPRRFFFFPFLLKAGDVEILNILVSYVPLYGCWFR
jgi:hypothetical protein